MNCRPWMIEIIAITDATPITMPSVVRKLRNACARIASNAARAPSAAANQIVTRARVLPPGLQPGALMSAAGGLLAIVFDDLAVFEPDDALAVPRDVGFVRDEHDRLPVRVELVEQREDLGTRLRVEVARRLIGQEDG